MKATSNGQFLQIVGCFLLYLLSPTRCIIDLIKGKDEETKRRRINRWRWFFLFLALCSLPVFSLWNFPHLVWPVSGHLWYVLIVLWFWPSSRIIEIVYAFPHDALTRLGGNGEPSGSCLAILRWRLISELSISSFRVSCSAHDSRTSSNLCTSA